MLRSLPRLLRAPDSRLLKKRCKLCTPWWVCKRARPAALDVVRDPAKSAAELRET